MVGVADSPPRTAFLVTGQCRSSAVLSHNGSIGDATHRFLESHRQHVLKPHDVAAVSTVFLLLKESSQGDCGTHLCDVYRGSACEQALLDDASCHMACPECTVKHNGNVALQNARCFSYNVLSHWTPIWCTMWLAWRWLLQYEQRSRVQHDRIVYSRVDVLFTSSMGHWSVYSKEWHSGHLWCA